MWHFLSWIWMTYQDFLENLFFLLWTCLVTKFFMSKTKSIKTLLETSKRKMLTIHSCVATILQTSSLTKPFWSFSVVVGSLWSSSRWGKLILPPKCFSRLIHFSEYELRVDWWFLPLFFHSSDCKKENFPIKFSFPPSVWDTLKIIFGVELATKIFVASASQKENLHRRSLYCFSKCFLGSRSL